MEKKKNVKYIILGFMVALVGIFAFGITDKGSLLWGVTTPHKSDTVYNMDAEVGGYNPNSETTLEMMEERYGKGVVDAPDPYYTEEKLFGKKCKYIVYGKILKAENYLLQTDTQAYYASHLLTVQVQNSIYGGIRRNKKVNILCRWMYKEDNPDAVEIGENGIFIIHGQPSLLNMEGNIKKLVTVGNMQRFYYYQYCMDSEKEGLDALKSKQEVIDYWKQEKMINVDSEEEEGSNKTADMSLVPVDITEKVSDTANMQLDNVNTACLASEPDMQEYIRESDAIVKGEITDIEYYEYNGIPWSKLYVAIEDVIAGKIKEDEVISVYVMEGYVENKELEEGIIKMEGDAAGLHRIGEEAIFVLSKEDGESVFEQGSYRRTFGCFSEYRHIGQNGEYTVNDADREVLSEKKLVAALEECLKE